MRCGAALGQEECWGGDGMVLGWCQSGAGVVLKWCLDGSGVVLGWYWGGTGMVPEWCWVGVGIVLGWYRNGTGVVLDSAGMMLGRCWGGVRMMLGWYWNGTGVVLGWCCCPFPVLNALPTAQQHGVCGPTRCPPPRACTAPHRHRIGPGLRGTTPLPLSRAPTTSPWRG